MSRKPAENPPLFPEEPLAEVAYCHDGSLEGLLSAVFEAYARREDPQDVARADVLQPRLGQTVRVIETNEEHAVRVRRGIRRTRALSMINSSGYNIGTFTLPFVQSFFPSNL
ncbi:MAG: hypothetical protein E6760_11665, partial [Eggerthella sp.]|nr:hypothetical protein [Eggerthella sp.]